MKNDFKFFQICLLMCGVFSAETDEVKTVSVMEGDSVTLIPDLTKIQGIIQMKWRDSHSVIAQFEENVISYPSLTEMSKDRLKLDQTGSLTITNMKTKHSGLYKLKIDHNNGTLPLSFSVTVYESPDVIDAFKGETKSVSETEGYPVTLQTDTETHGDELIVWRFGDEGKLIAKHDLEAKSLRLYNETDERFRDRLKLDHQTGSLTITNTKTTDSGAYKVKISSSKQTLYKKFTVTVSAVPVPDPGLSPGAVAGIVVVLLVFSAVAAAVVFYYRRKVSELLKQMKKSVSVMEWADVTLPANTEIQTGDEIFWMFGDDNSPVAKNTEEKCEEESEFRDSRFKDKVYLNHQTGDLTIKRIRFFHTGKYKLKIIRNGKSSFKLFSVTVYVNKSVLKGDSVTLNYDTEIQRDDKIQWKFGEKLIAEMTGENRENPQWTDEFRDQMELYTLTGSLTIQQTRAEHSGLYKLEINTRDNSTSILYRIIVFDEQKSVSVMEGADVTLRAKIQTGDKIFWMFGDYNRLLAKNTEEKCEEEFECNDSRFTDKVDLNPQTGDLTIKTIRFFHTGEYKLKIIRNGKASFKLFSVTVSEHQVNKSVLKGHSALLNYNTVIQKDDKIQWKFGEKLIAEMTGENRENPQWTDEFRAQMELYTLTGSLTIQQTRPEHTGLYKLEIKTSYSSTFRLFRIIVCDEVNSVSVMEGKDVTLPANTGKIQTGDKIFWMFGDDNSLVDKNTEEKCEEESEFSYSRFKHKVDLNHQTGDLTIKTIKPDHTGKYKLKIIRNGKSSFKLFNVTVSGPVNKSVLKGRPVTLNYNTEIQKDDKIQWKFEEKLIAEMTGENCENPQWTDDEFRDQMKLDPQTGSLTIQQTRSEHSGLYKLEIKTRYYSTFRFFRITVCDEVKSMSVMKVEDETLPANTGKQTGDKSGDDNCPVAKNTEDACSSYSVTDEEKRKLLKDSTEKRKNDSVAVEMQRF